MRLGLVDDRMEYSARLALVFDVGIEAASVIGHLELWEMIPWSCQIPPLDAGQWTSAFEVAQRRRIRLAGLGHTLAHHLLEITLLRHLFVSLESRTKHPPRASLSTREEGSLDSARPEDTLPFAL